MLSLLGGVLLAASCGGDPVDAGTGGDGDGDVGDGDGDVGDGDGDVGDGDRGDGDGDGDTGGMPGDGDGAGGSSSGGDEGTGGALDTSTGGDEGSGGDQGSGTGGDQGTVTTATLGDPCGAPGAFACAETNPKLALICGGDNEWEFRETCEEEQFCDSYEGLGLGTCRVPLPECEVVTGAFCDDDDSRVVECAESGFETVVVEECASGYGCVNGSCAQVDDPCPSPGTIHNCSGDDCTSHKPAWCEPDDNCENLHWGYALLAGETTTVVRIPSEGLCLRGGCATPAYSLVMSQSSAYSDMAMRFTVGPGWGMVAYADGVGDACGSLVEACIVIPPGASTVRGVHMVPLSDDPVIRNVTIEAVEPGTTCD